MKQLWGKEYESTYGRFERAVTDSGGACMFYRGELAKPYYHLISAKRTRSGQELFGDEAYGYLCSVNSEQDMTADNYMTIKSFKKGELLELLGESGAALSEASKEAVSTCFETGRLDKQGYVLWMMAAGKRMDAQAFQEQFGLPSACFEIEEWKDGIRFICRGQGHGLGMSLHGADCLAKEGRNYEEILNYFFHDITIKTTEHE